MLVPLLCAACVVLAALLLSHHSKLRDARASNDALKTVGGRQRDKLTAEVSEARAERDQAQRDLGEARATLALLDPGPSLVGRTVSIRTPDDDTLRGVLHAQHADRWTLRDVVVVTAVGEQPAGGLMHVPVGQVSWAQELEPQQIKPAPVAHLKRSRSAR